MPSRSLSAVSLTHTGNQRTVETRWTRWCMGSPCRVLSKDRTSRVQVALIQIPWTVRSTWVLSSSKSTLPSRWGRRIVVTTDKHLCRVSMGKLGTSRWHFIMVKWSTQTEKHFHKTHNRKFCFKINYKRAPSCSRMHSSRSLAWASTRGSRPRLCSIPLKLPVRSREASSPVNFLIIKTAGVSWPTCQLFRIGRAVSTIK